MWSYLDDGKTSRAAEFITRLETIELVQRNTDKGCIFRDPPVTKRVTLPATGKQVWGRIDGCFLADAVR